MGSKLAEWLIRTVMLVLAGLVTLSILGSIAAVSNQAGNPGAIGGRDRAVIAPAPQPSPPAPEALPKSPAPSQAQPPAPEAGGTAAPGELVTVPAPPEEPAERWLEAIAYALLAIAGLFALLLILVWRGVRALARIADRADLGQHRI